MVGNYVELPDAYISAIESLKHASYENMVHLNLKFVNPNQVTNDNIDETFTGIQGILLIDPYGEK